MHIRDPETGGEELTFNLTPMIDVVFMLLIFFMLATTFLDPEKELDLELPRAESGQALDIVPEELVINVLRDGSITLSGRDVGEDELLDVLERAAKRDPETPVTIRGDRLAHHEAIVGVMDACGIAGLCNLAVGTLRDRQGG